MYVSFYYLHFVRVRTPPTSVSSQPPSSLKLCFTLCHCSFLEDIFGSQNSCSEICQGRAWRFGATLCSLTVMTPPNTTTHTHTHTARPQQWSVVNLSPLIRRSHTDGRPLYTAAATATHALRVCGPRARALSPLLQPAGACRWGLGIVDAVLF